jgi:hypothetical protein
MIRLADFSCTRRKHCVISDQNAIGRTMKEFSKWIVSVPPTKTATPNSSAAQRYRRGLEGDLAAIREQIFALHRDLRAALTDRATEQRKDQENSPCR